MMKLFRGYYDGFKPEWVVEIRPAYRSQELLKAVEKRETETGSWEETEACTGHAQ